MKSHRVQDPRAQRVITDDDQFRYLLPFMGQTRTITDVAGQLGVSVNAVYYRVRRFCSLGLVREVDALPRAGRPQKRYRAVADAFFLPMAGIDLWRFNEAHDRYYGRWFADSALQAARDHEIIGGESGFTIYRRDDGRYDSFIGQEHAPSDPPDDLPIVWGWYEVALSDEQARALAAAFRRALRAVQQDPPAKRARRHLVGTFLAPALDDRPPLDTNAPGAPPSHE